MADQGDKKRKYLLFKKDDGRPDHLKPCAFFASAEGCKNGSRCRFMHDPAAAPGGAAAAPAPVAAPVYVPPAPQVSFQVKQAPAPAVAQEAAPSPKKEKKKRRTNDFLEHHAAATIPVNSVPLAPAHFAPPAAVVAAPAAPSNDYLLLMQQKQQLEEQLRSLSAAMTAPVPVAVAPQPVAAYAPFAAPAPVAPQPVAPTTSSKKERRASHTPAPAPTPSSSSKLQPGKLFPSSNIVIGGAPVPMPVLPVSVLPPPLVPAPAPAVPVVAAPAPLSAPQTSDGFDSSSDDEEFLFKAVNHALNNGRSDSVKSQPLAAAPPAGQKTPRTPKTPRSAPTPAPVTTTVAASTMDVMSLLPSADNSSFPFVDPLSAVKALETSGTPHATLGPNGKKIRKDIFAAPPTPAKTGPPTFEPASVNFAAIDWQALVARTKAHKRYKTDYTFNVDHTWIAARTEAQWPGNNAPKVIAIDCEMCETGDPVTGKKDPSALIRFSVVNGLDPSQVLIDTLVAPSMPVTDMRTRIHGLTEEQLAPVQYTLRHAQAALYNLITDQTIIIGHSVYNDLKALRFAHSQCIDTAYLYTLEGEGDSIPSLRLVSEQALGFQLVDSHDSVEDACASLYAAAHIGIKGTVPGLQRKTPGSDKEPSLLLHRLPDYCQEEHIMRVFATYTNIIPAKIAPLTRGDPSSTDAVGKTTVVFTSQAHADLAFESITGPVRPDKQNRPQKRIYLKGGGYIYVRK